MTELPPEPPPHDRTSRLMINVVAFGGGFVSIGLELTASRLVAPYFGSSTFIWANLIGITLAFLSLGYFLGGRMADRFPSARRLYPLIGAAGIAIAVIPLISRPILRLSLDGLEDRDAGAFLGSLFATLLLFAPAMTLLGMIAPYAIRLRLRSVADAGRAAGGLYALSTAGSILGSFIPVLILTPWIGTRLTLLVLAALLIIMSITGLLFSKGARGASLIALPAIVSLLASLIAIDDRIKPPYRGELIAEFESDNNYVQVLQDGEQTLLALNEGQAIHSIYDPNQLTTGGPWDYFLLGPYLASDAPPSNAMIIGLAGGTTARQLDAAFPGVELDGVEVDPVVADVAEDYFGITDELVDVRVADGRYALRTSDDTYDLICIDAYRQPYVPFHLATTEFFGEVSDRLTSTGVVAINAGRTSTDFRLVDALSSTLGAVFKTVVVVDVDRFTNSLIFATNASTSLEAFVDRLGSVGAIPVVADTAPLALEAGHIRPGSTDGPILTDDRAPIEWIIDQIIVDEALREEP